MREITITSLAILATAILGAASSFAAEGPPMSNGAIANPTLVENQAVAKAQTVGIITTFMGKGAQECDDDGKNCRSLFGADDSLDYTSVQLSGSSTTGIQAFSYLSGDSSADKMDTNSVASQTGTLVLACGDTKVKTVAGIALKVLSCSVTPAGDAQMTYKVCTGPSRGTPVEKPSNTMVCSSDPTAPNFKPAPGYVCERPACDSEPEGSLNGWTSTQTISYVQSVAQSGSEDAKSKNGLGFAFYPALGAGVSPSFSANSDNMVAVKVVQTALNSDTKQSALGLRVAFRHKALVTKEMMIQGASAVPNPEKNTAQWDTVLKLQGNALIPQFQQKYAANGAECMTQINNGIATDGVISVCDQQYTNESGVRPRALTAQVAAEGQNCSNATQCLQEVVNTNTWEQTCSAEVPLSIRKCTTKTDYEIETLSWVRTKTTEQCYETRAVNTYSCRYEASIGAATTVWAPATDLDFSGSTAAQTVLKFDRLFQTPAATQIVEARIGNLHVDNWGEIRLNGVRIWANLNNNLNQVLNADTYNNCGNDNWTETYFDGEGTTYEYPVSGVRCTMPDGQRVRANYNDDCYGVCTGPTRVNHPIPADLVKLNSINVLQMSCFNNKGPSACNFSVELRYLNITKYEIKNECTSYENAR